MSTDGSIVDYRKRLHEWTSEEGWQSSFNSLTVSDKFVDGVAQPLSGWTLLTPPASENPPQNAFYQHLVKLREKALSAFDVVLNEVPGDCLHVTGADLISGQRYLRKRRSMSHFDEALRDSVGEVIAEQSIVHGPLLWKIEGLAFFQHALVCLLAPFTENDYQPVVRLRRALYTHEGLLTLGVRRPLPFLAHVTLAYYQRLPAIHERLGWLAVHAELQELARQFKGNFAIDRFDLRSFNDMTAYHPTVPEVSWRCS